MDLESPGSILGLTLLALAALVLVHWTGSFGRAGRTKPIRLNSTEWEAVANSVPDLITILDDDRRILFTNRAMGEMFGQSPEQCIGRHCYEVIHGTDKPSGCCPFGWTLDDGQVHTVELRDEHVGRDFLVRTVPLRTAGGRRIGTIHLAHDITPRKQAERALRESEERFRNLAEAVPQLVWLVDAEGKAVFLNRLWCEYFTGDCCSAEARAALIHPDDLPLVKRNFAEAIERGGRFECEYRMRLKDGQYRWFLGRTIILRDAQGRITGRLGAAADIHDLKTAEQACAIDRDQLDLRVRKRTAELAQTNQALAEEVERRKSAQDALKQLNETLEQNVRARTADLVLTIDELQEEVNQRLAAERALTDANGALTNQAAQLRTLARDVTLAEQRERTRLAKVLHDHLQQLLVAAQIRVSLLGRTQDPQVKSAADEIAHLITESIIASRSLTMDLSPPVLHQADLAGALKWLAEWVSEKHGLTVGLVTDDDLPEPAEDVKVLMFESVRELLFNAAKHAQDRRATVRAHALDDRLWIIVADHGVGFDPKAVKINGGGATFGLASIRDRLSLIGGHMEIDSTPGQGSRFVLSAPLNAAPAPAPAPQGGVPNVCGAVPTRQDYESPAEIGGA